jgi:Ni,Fe-hydrogenase I cytochrome b subunit
MLSAYLGPKVISFCIRQKSNKRRFFDAFRDRVWIAKTNQKWYYYLTDNIIRNDI